MKQPKNLPTQYTAFVRGLRDFSADHQRKLIAKAVAALGGKVVAEYDAATQPGERDEWIKRTRPAEGAIVAGLYVIPEPPVPKVRPSADFVMALQWLATSCAIIVDAETMTTSRDGQAWLDLIKSAAGKTAKGRQLTPRRGREMAKKRWAKAEPGAVERWKSPAMQHAVKRYSAIWRDPVNKNDAAAFLAMPADVQRDLGSPTTARRVFGRRKPDNPAAGGRGKKRPVKSKRKR